MSELWIYSIICPGVNLSHTSHINAILRRTAQLYCHSGYEYDDNNALDEFIRFHEFNVDRDSVPKGTHEAFNDDDDDPLYEWECDAICVQETLVKQLHVPRGRYRKR
jgi:hypothetical protein